MQKQHIAECGFARIGLVVGYCVLCIVWARPTWMPGFSTRGARLGRWGGKCVGQTVARIQAKHLGSNNMHPTQTHQQSQAPTKLPGFQDLPGAKLLAWLGTTLSRR